MAKQELRRCWLTNVKNKHPMTNEETAQKLVPLLQLPYEAILVG